MAAARPRIATALVALGLFVAVCIGGDHGAARAAVGQATGPLIGSRWRARRSSKPPASHPGTCAWARSR